MLRISKLADYGTVVMVYLARRRNQLCNVREIAAETHITIPMVSKLLKRLTNRGLLSSVRGVAGGYQLRKPATEISVASIIYALEEQHGLTECSHSKGCSLQAVCHVQGNWQLISQAVETALDSVSLASLAQPILKPTEVQRVRQLASGVGHE